MNHLQTKQRPFSFALTFWHVIHSRHIRSSLVMSSTIPTTLATWDHLRSLGGEICWKYRPRIAKVGPEAAVPADGDREEDMEDALLHCFQPLIGKGRLLSGTWRTFDRMWCAHSPPGLDISLLPLNVHLPRWTQTSSSRNASLVTHCWRAF